VLVNNAGALCHERQLSVDGVEQTFATHVVAPWILTNRLKPAKTIHNLSGGLLLVEALVLALVPLPPYRHSSLDWLLTGMLTQKLSLDQIEAQFESATFDGTQVYAQCKRALFEATQWLHQSGSYQHAVSSHPGAP
jgi:NAD(P)-dependent dehydrogenase (short-subunit alcohol dehydrogenase family)